MDTRIPQSLASRKSQALSSIGNINNTQRHASSHGYEYTSKGNQPHSHKSQQLYSLDDRLQKENRPPPGCPPPLQRTPSQSDYRHAGYLVNRSFGTNNNNRSSPTRPHPSTGGKTISSTLMKKVSRSGCGDDGSSNRTFNKNNHSNNDDHSCSHHRRIKQKQRVEQRMSPEQLKLLSRRIDPSLPASPRGSPSKPILPSIFTNDADHDTFDASHRHSSRHIHSISSTSLYQTCIDLWPSEPTLGDLASDNIKNLTNLLKVRLSQAKYRVLAELEDDNHKHTNPSLLSAAHILRDDIDYSTWPTFEKHTISLSSKRSCGSTCVSGNGARLFRKTNSYLQSRRLQQQKQQYRQDFGLALSPLADRGTSLNRSHQHQRTPVSLPPPSPSSHTKTDVKKKRKFKTKPAEKVLRSDGRDQASKISPIKLEDGSFAFVCTPCNKKYKTRNGLAYHLDRCAHIPLANETTSDNQTINNSSGSQSPGSKSSGVHCVCDHPTDDEEMMVKCDECQLWLHLDCVGTNDGALDDIYHCPRCVMADHPTTKRRRTSETPKAEQLPVASLIFQQLNDPTAQPDFSATTDLHPLSFNDTATKSSLFHSQSSSIQPSLWDNILDNNAMPSSSTSAPNAMSSETPSLSNVKNGDSADLWGLSTIDIPSLLYSDAATGLASTLDDDCLTSVMDLPSSELCPNDLPPTDWFQFANFDDDFHCDDPQPIPQ